jgi:hydroxylamine reductase
MNMFCYQCEQKAQEGSCTKVGVCGKDPISANLQDLIVHGLKSLSVYGARARELDVRDEEVDLHLIEGLYSTVTNVDFESARLLKIAEKTYAMKEKIKGLFLRRYEALEKKKFASALPAIADWKIETDIDRILEQATDAGIPNRNESEDIKSLAEILTYGLKGMAAYADHAVRLGYMSEEVFAFFHKALAYTAVEDPDADTLLGLIVECGSVNIKCMELLDKAHTETLGNPTPTKIGMGYKKGHAILVSGHDLLDLYELLKQTEGKGINVYTHGEMLPAHGYPALKKFAHLAGNYGGAWQDQQKEFDKFLGAILMTTNCIQKPRESYIDRIFTTGLVAYPGVTHVPGRKDFGKVIDKALSLEGFKIDNKEKEILVGFGHEALLGAADKIVDLVKRGKIRRFFLIGGCDGAKPGRNYYTELAENIPDDCVILTLACGKYRFNKFDFGDIEGIPRLIDIAHIRGVNSQKIHFLIPRPQAFEQPDMFLPNVH